MERYNVIEVANKLFCTFVPRDTVLESINTITSHYSVLYKKVFVLETDEEEGEYLCTYNIDPYNSQDYILPNTILLHRKKESNTLYTINGLNALIRHLNNGTVDPHYRVDWPTYRNTVLLSQGPDLRKLHTKIFKIVEL